MPTPKPWHETRSTRELIVTQQHTHRHAMRAARESSTAGARCFWLKQAGAARRVIAYYRGLTPTWVRGDL